MQQTCGSARNIIRIQDVYLANCSSAALTWWRKNSRKFPISVVTQNKYLHEQIRFLTSGSLLWISCVSTPAGGVPFAAFAHFASFARNTPPARIKFMERTGARPDHFSWLQPGSHDRQLRAPGWENPSAWRLAGPLAAQSESPLQRPAVGELNWSFRSGSQTCGRRIGVSDRAARCVGAELEFPIGQPDVWEPNWSFRLGGQTGGNISAQVYSGPAELALTQVRSCTAHSQITEPPLNQTDL